MTALLMLTEGLALAGIPADGIFKVSLTQWKTPLEWFDNPTLEITK